MTRNSMVALSLVGLIFGGCAGAAAHRPGDAQSAAAPARGVHVEVIPSDAVDLSTPDVRRDGDAVIIAGTVTRKVAALTGAEAIDGHVDLFLLASADDDDDPVPLTLIPTKNNSAGGERVWRYELRCADVVPHAIVRVAFSDDDVVDTSAADGGISTGGHGFSGYPVSGNYETHTPGTPRQSGSRGSRSNSTNSNIGHSAGSHSGGSGHGFGTSGFGGMR